MGTVCKYFVLFINLRRTTYKQNDANYYDGTEYRVIARTDLQGHPGSMIFMLFKSQYATFY